jgi:hypothetical protein
MLWALGAVDELLMHGTVALNFLVVKHQFC